MPPPVPPPPKPMATPAAQASLQPGFVAAAATAQPQPTQTVQAPQALGKGDAARRSMGASDVGHAKDTLAGTVNAEASRVAAGGPGPRGSLLDLRV